MLLHSQLLMKGAILRLGKLRLTNLRKHSEVAEIWWQQYSFLVPGGLDSLADRIAGIERVCLNH